MYIACDIAGASRKDSDGAPFAQKAMRQLPAQGRSAIHSEIERKTGDARQLQAPKLSLESLTGRYVRI
jgi:hypothetical protein